MLFKAQKQGIIAIDYVNLRNFGLGPHKSVDDTPYGGGDGMLLRCEPVFAAIESIKKDSPEAEVILPTPVGVTWSQTLARQFAGITTPAEDENLADMAKKRSLARVEKDGAGEITSICQERLKERSADREEREPREDGCSSGSLETNVSNLERRHFIILCSHYEGYDERILTIVDHPISLGNYVLTGGELPALIIIDSVARLLPGVLGGETSAMIESFSNGDNLEYPQYTKPADFRGLKVPEVLMSGNHGAIAKWRAEHSGKQNR